MQLAEIFQERFRLYDTIRAFFKSRGFVEVETPLLVECPDLSPTLTHFVTQEHLGLITSPEFSMKKLLGSGMEKIFVLTKVFRNGEANTGQHRREFMMLEWYEQGNDYMAGMQQTEELVNSVLGLAVPFVRLHLPTRFFEITGLDYADASMEDMKGACEKLGLTTDPNDSWSDLFHRIFVTQIEHPCLSVFVYDFPKQQAALAALTSDGKYAQRFELYINGIELCNAFTELTDAVEQRARFEEELVERKQLGKELFPIDEDLLALLPSVRNPTFGNALGMDRLLMLKLGIKNIRDLYGFSQRHKEINRD